MDKKNKILIIEDERPMAHALELKLTKLGFDTRAVSNGEDAIVILKNEAFTLILLDLVMPKMDGFEVLEYLKERKIEVPVIVLSNLSQVEDERRARALGAKEFFIKSNTPIAFIIERVAQLLK